MPSGQRIKDRTCVCISGWTAIRGVRSITVRWKVWRMASIRVSGGRLHGTKMSYLLGGGTAFGAVAALGVAIHGGFAIAGASSELVDDWLYCGLFMLAAASCALRAWRGDARAAWAFAAVGVFLWGTAEIVFRLSVSDPRRLVPAEHRRCCCSSRFASPTQRSVLLARERVRHFDPVLALDGLLAGPRRRGGRGGAAVPRPRRAPRPGPGRAAAGVPARGARRADVRRRRPRHDRLAARAVVGADRGRDRGQRRRRRGARAPGRRGTLPPRVDSPTRCSSPPRCCSGSPRSTRAATAPVPRDAARRLPAPLLSAAAALAVLIARCRARRRRARRRTCRGRAGGDDRAHVDRARAARAQPQPGAHRRPHRSRQPAPARARPRTAARAGGQATRVHARAVRPRRVQALQRHLRSSERRRAARCVSPAVSPLRLRPGSPTGWAATSSARSSREREAPAETALAKAHEALSEHGDAFSITSSTGSRRLSGGGRERAAAHCGSPTSACTPRRRGERSTRCRPAMPC